MRSAHEYFDQSRPSVSGSNDMKIKVTMRRLFPLLARAIPGDRRGHAPAHALPPAERPKVKRIPNLRKPEHHATRDRVRTAEALGARRVSTKMRQWLVRVNLVPRIPEVADVEVADTQVICESVWQRGARIAGSPAFGVAAAACLVCAWVVFGEPTRQPPADGPTAHGAGINPRTAHPRVSGSAPSSRHTEVPHGDAPDVHIDSQFLATLEKTFSDLDRQAGHYQPKHQEPGGDEPGPLANQTDAPASDTAVPEAAAIVPHAPPVANQDGQAVDAPASETPIPGAAAIAPHPPAVANQDGQTADAPVSAPEEPAIAPLPPAAANPNGTTADAISLPPLGPPPGPAA
jgi:hypothetical protein